jgi:nicotinamide-nucleotide amidase
MIAEILATGDEIRTGALIDSNSAHIAEKLEQAGVMVARHHAAGDDLNILIAVLKEIGQRADIAVVTGGLGPTVDDLSAAAAAGAAGVELALNPEARETVERFFKTFNRPMTESNRKQAWLPKGASCLDNPVGTAPGFSLEIGRCQFFFLPGVPYEMKKMLEEKVLPKISEMLGQDHMFRRVKTLSTFGLPESLAGEKVAEIATLFPDIKLGLRARFPEIQIKLYGSAGKEADLTQRLEDAGTWVKQQLGRNVFSDKGRSMEEVIGKLLTAAGATLAIAESCTGGLLAHRLTNVSGSSAYFLLSAVTYSNPAKMAMLGVKPETLNRWGAVSEEIVAQMAAGVRRLAGANFGLATSGIAGPSGGSPEKPVGTVCIGLSDDHGTVTRKLYFPFGKRLMNKSIFAMAALDILRRKLEDSLTPGQRESL